MAGSMAVAVDVTFNITQIAEENPHPPTNTLPGQPPGSTSSFSYGDLWAENDFIYVGSDRGRLLSPHENLPRGRGVAIFSISNSGDPTFQLRDISVPPPQPGYVDTTYIGNEIEDVEVYNGIGYFASDTNDPDASPRTGVDIVNLADPAIPQFRSRVDTSDCLVGNPSVCAHGKVHTVSIQRFYPGTPDEERYMYTSDNASPTVKVTNVSDPMNPQLIASIDLPYDPPTNTGSMDAHEVAVRNNRLYVASKNPGSSSTDGWVHIYDVSTPSSPVLVKKFLSGASTHTAMPTADGNTLVVAEERSNGNVKLYNIEDPQNPILVQTINRTNVCRFYNGDGDCSDVSEQRIDAHSPHHLHIYGNLLFLPWYEAGLQVFNIVDPANPVYVGAFDTYVGTNTNFSGNWGVDLSLGLDRVLLSDRQRGLIVVNATGVLAQGDYNMDMVVNGEDRAVWSSAFGIDYNGLHNFYTSSAHDPPFGDGNYDELINAADYVVWRKFEGTTGPVGYQVFDIPGGSGSPSVPEPGSVVLSAGGAAWMVLMRQRLLPRNWRVGGNIIEGARQNGLS
jgi:hypothetical protein